MGASKGLSEAEAIQFHDRLRPYRESLISSGWRIPKLFHTRVVGLNREYQLFSYEELIPGGDGEQMLADPAQPNFRKWFMIEEVMRTLFGYPDSHLRRGTVAGRTVSLLPHGLDLKPAKVVLEEPANHLYFVDLFGPKVLDDGQWRTFSPKLDSLSPENLLAVCATREGALLRFWRLAQQLWEPTDKERRFALQVELLGRLKSFDPPSEELEFIETEFATRFQWLNELYGMELEI